MAWVLPVLIGARYLTTPTPTSNKQLLANGQSVNRSRLNELLKDPYQPMLNDTLGVPRQRAPKTYRGKVEYPKPANAAQLNAPPANLERSMIKMDRIPYNDNYEHILANQEAYRRGDMIKLRPWKLPVPDYRGFKRRSRYWGHLPDDNVGGARADRGGRLESVTTFKRPLLRSISISQKLPL